MTKIEIFIHWQKFQAAINWNINQVNKVNILFPFTNDDSLLCIRIYVPKSLCCVYLTIYLVFL